MKQFFTLFFTCSLYLLSAQHLKADFESFLSHPDTFWNGSDLSGGFQEENAFFPNHYQIDTVWGSYWASGWAISSMRDDTTGDYTNLYSSKPASGYHSEGYAVGQQNATLRIIPTIFETTSPGFYVTNTTYAYHSMKYGDFFTDAFGGVDGSDPDFFKLVISGYFRGQLIPDSVTFYLADYRFEDSNDDYIIDEWEWVDLFPLHYCDSLLFTMSSSKKNENGYLTPLFFCMDDFEVFISVSVDEQKSEDLITLSPNPTHGPINIQFDHPSSSILGIKVFDMIGNIQLVNNQELNGRIHLETLDAGFYIIQIETEQGFINKKIQKF